MTIEEAKALLIDAEKSNPGQWVSHSRTTAHCAEKIAQYSGLLVKFMFRAARQYPGECRETRIDIDRKLSRILREW